MGGGITRDTKSLLHSSSSCSSSNMNLKLGPALLEISCVKYSLYLPSNSAVGRNHTLTGHDHRHHEGHDVTSQQALIKGIRSIGFGSNVDVGIDTAGGGWHCTCCCLCGLQARS